MSLAFANQLARYTYIPESYQSLQKEAETGIVCCNGHDVANNNLGAMEACRIHL